ncbi:ATP-binding protein [Thermodesulfobacteriota bacterium]
MEEVYKRLAKHLDDLPVGFPATETGVELRILQRLFTPEEAEAALGLKMVLEPVSTIAEHLNRDEEDLVPILETMAQKGLILKSTRGDIQQYMAAQFMPGIWGSRVNDLDEHIVKDFHEYSPSLEREWANLKTKWIRTIPIRQSVSADMQIMPYEEAERIIQSQSKIVVAPCVCRQEQKVAGAGCDKPIDNCLFFSGGAYLHEERGIGRTISRDEALQILNEAVEAGLVIQPGNAQKPMNLCFCCGCCCHMLKTLKRADRPALVANSSYYALVDEAACIACGTCEDRCQMDAVTVADTAQIDLDQCIGCGLCVPTCEFGAIRLVEKETSEKWVPPRNTTETFLNIAKERGKV